MKDVLLGLHVVVWQTTSKNSTKVRAACAARLFFHLINQMALMAFDQSDYCSLLLSLPLSSSLVKGLFTWREAGPANRATLGGLTFHTFL